MALRVFLCLISGAYLKLSGQTMSLPVIPIELCLKCPEKYLESTEPLHFLHDFLSYDYLPQLTSSIHFVTASNAFTSSTVND